MSISHNPNSFSHMNQYATSHAQVTKPYLAHKLGHKLLYQSSHTNCMRHKEGMSSRADCAMLPLYPWCMIAWWVGYLWYVIVVLCKFDDPWSSNLSWWRCLWFVNQFVGMILDNSIARPDVSQSLYHDQDAHSWLKPKINIRVFINA